MFNHNAVSGEHFAVAGLRQSIFLESQLTFCQQLRQLTVSALSQPHDLWKNLLIHLCHLLQIRFEAHSHICFRDFFSCSITMSSAVSILQSQG